MVDQDWAGVVDSMNADGLDEGSWVDVVNDWCRVHDRNSARGMKKKLLWEDDESLGMETFLRLKDWCGVDSVNNWRMMD